MQVFDSTSPAPRDKEPKRFLIGSIRNDPGILKCCPTSSTLLCTEKETGLPAYIALACKRWGCIYCGQRKAFHLACRCEVARPQRFITLTIDPKRWESPRAAYDGTRRKLSDFAKALRASRAEFEYLRVLEVTKKGWPHYHFLARCPYIPQKEISRIWAELTGAVIVDVRRVDKGTNVFKYVLKYLCKQQHVPWTSRRVSWSHSFFPKPEQSEPRANPFTKGNRLLKHPADVLATQKAGKVVIERRPGVWVIEDAKADETIWVSTPNYEAEIQCPKSQTPEQRSPERVKQLMGRIRLPLQQAACHPSADISASPCKT